MSSATVITFIISFIVIAALVGLELRLSTRKNRWLGLIPIAAVTAIVIVFNLILIMTAGSYTTVTRTAADDNGNQYEIVLRYNKAGDLMDFSDLRIKNRNGELADQVYLSFDEAGRLESDSDRALYQQSIERLMEGQKLTGSSKEEEIESNMIPLGDGLYVSVDRYWPLTVLWVAVPMIPVYVIGRLIVRSKRRKAEMKKMRLQSL